MSSGTASQHLLIPPDPSSQHHPCIFAFNRVQHDARLNASPAAAGGIMPLRCTGRVAMKRD